MPENPNPQGKGLVPVMQGIQQHRLLQQVLPKQIDQIEMELFTSLFVLHSEFKFSPVAERSYWLYQLGGHYKLMLVAPDEWQSSFSGRFIGECILQLDRTWTLNLSDEVAADQHFMDTITQEQARLHQLLTESEKIEEALPRFNDKLGFYSRVLSFTLAKSLDASMQLSGIKGLGYAEAKGLLTSAVKLKNNGKGLKTD